MKLLPSGARKGREALIILLTAGRFWQARLRTRGAAPEGYPVERRDPESSMSGFSWSR